MAASCIESLPARPAPRVDGDTACVSRWRGCLLGGALGDALGAPVEFMSRQAIVETWGEAGLARMVPAYGRPGAITDDTQMTLFTAEGLLRAHVRGCLKGVTSYPGVTAHAYLRWLSTQGEQPLHDIAFGRDTPGWLYERPELHARRAPGLTCLSALRAMPTLGAPARNDSKGCGGVMRVAPAGLFTARTTGIGMDEAFALGVQLAALTHGHPSGQLPAGVLAALIHQLVQGTALPAALDAVRVRLRTEADHAQTLAAIDLARTLAAEAVPPVTAIARLGQGWVAEEALAIALYCALVSPTLRDGIVLAINHDGDSDSTGSIAGQLLGALHGEAALPAEWLEVLELREVIITVATDLYEFPAWGDDEPGSPSWDDIWLRYPGY